MLKNIAIGIAVGFATLWLWDQYERSRGSGGTPILARVTRMWSAPSPRDLALNVNPNLEAPSSGGCGCS